ncbi:MAG: glutaredoxin family protein [Candidatus Methylomirabilales bacterium]
MERCTARIPVVLYTRLECCLCQEMKGLLDKVSREYPMDLAEVDIDEDPELRERFGQEVPVLFIEGRKAIKYRTTERELRKRLDHAAFRKQNIADPPFL